MNEREFATAFLHLSGNRPFPWQWELYQRFVAGEFPSSCRLPTGLGKTSIIHLWLLALARAPGQVPRRLVYVVNRRTVVDQATDEARKLRERLGSLPELAERLRLLCGLETPLPLAISTLRGQFADNREWSADPCRPAVIVGTVDMIGSRLLFSGYGVGFKAKPLHAGFLGQDALLVHDEAHLEPAFQELLGAIEKEQRRCKELRPLRVIELSATSRGAGEAFQLTPRDREHPVVLQRIEAKKALHLHESADDKKLADEVAAQALGHRDTGRAVLVFVRKVEDVEKVVGRLHKEKQRVQQLTGTLRGLERDRLVRDAIFARFLPPANRPEGVVLDESATVYLVCTSAGEVGVNLSADHLACDLSTFDSMAQRFGRVNRFGQRDDTRIDVVYPKELADEDEIDGPRRKTLKLLRALNGEASPAALDRLDPVARRDAFAPPPTIVPVLDILLDAWAMTTIRGRLPGRPPVEPYLHGVRGWEPPETYVAWRQEVGKITGELLQQYSPEDLLDDYPLKPHELLRDNTSRVFDRLKKLRAATSTPVWVVANDGAVTATTLGEIIAAGKDELAAATVLLPPEAGGLRAGMLASDSTEADDVADEWYEDQGEQVRRRVRVWNDDPRFAEKTRHLRPIRAPIDTRRAAEEDDAEGRRYWYWFERPADGDSDGSKANRLPVLWQVHTRDVVTNVTAIVAQAPVPEALRAALVVAAQLHDHGKRRRLFQKVLGNFDPAVLLAKSGKQGGRLPELYRHEFGSLLDAADAAEFQALGDHPELQELILHLIAAHHGRGRPHFPDPEVFDPEHASTAAAELASAVPRRYARLQRTYGRWGLAYLESLLRAADYAASANPSAFWEVPQ